MPDVGFPVRVDSVLLELATQRATGCLTLTEPEGDQSTVWFRDGQVYAVSVPGRRPLLGVRLMSSGALTPEALAEALEVQRTELQGWRLGELLVHLQFVDRAVVESFVTEQVRDQVADLLHWTVVESKFRNGNRTRQDVAPPIEVTDLLALAAERDSRWTEIVPFIGGADGVPVLSTSSDAASDVVLGPYDWALLCKVDGNRTIADLADDCGFTVFEAGMVVVGLLDAGLVEVENLAHGVEVVEPWQDMSADEDPTEDELSASVAKVAAALHDMNLGPSVASPFSARPVVHDVYAAPQPATGGATAPTDDTPRRSPFAATPVVEDVLADVVSLADEREARDEAEAGRVEAERLTRERRAAEQAAALEAQQIEQERLAAQLAELAELERLAADAAARAEAEPIEQERIAAEQAEAERLAAEEAERAEAERIEAERIDAERLAAEEAARAEAERLEQERIAAEQAEAERLEQERLEQERLAAEQAEAERIAAELSEAAAIEDAWAAAERLAAEHAEEMRREHEAREAERIERERIAAEEAEAARLEAERITAEHMAYAEAERLEHERLAAEEAARLEAERLAAEEAARLEAERLAAEEAARAEAERLEQERVAAEEAERAEHERNEQERLAAERAEAERIEAERAEAERVEQERLAAERAEAERIEAERLAAEEAARAEAERIEQERLAAERAEAERIEAERLAAEEAARAEAERIEQERLAAERAEAERIDAERAEADRIEAERLAAEEAERLEAELLAEQEAERAEQERLEAERVEDEQPRAGMDLHAVNAEFTALSLDPPMTAPVEIDPPTFELDEEPPAAVAAYRPDFGSSESHHYEPELEPVLAGGGARPEGTDMAALLRELSSLGGAFDAEPGSGSGTAPSHVVTRPVSATPDKGGKKKKGFFGR